MTTTIKVRLNGPYAIDLTTNDVALIDHDGNPITIPAGKTTLALCRCGQSENKPFCDASHKRSCWVAVAAQPAEGETTDNAPVPTAPHEGVAAV